MTTSPLDVMARKIYETKQLLQIAWPLILSSLISMGISITDVIMTGWLGPLQLASAAAASDFYSVIYYGALGVVAALSPLIGQAIGRGDRIAIRRYTQQAFWVVLVLCLPGCWIVWQSSLFLSLLGVKEEIVVTSVPYSQMMSLTFAFMLLSMVWHYFFSAHKQTQIIFRTMLLILPLNGVLNYLLMYGFLGVPPLGLAGVGLSSVLCALTMFTLFSLVVFRSRRYRGYRLNKGLLRLYPQSMQTIFRIGLPIGMINLAELGVFLFSTVIMGTVSVEALAAHTAAIRLSGVIYAIPLGLAQAVAIRVAFSVGAKDEETLRNAAISAYQLALVVGLGYLCMLWLLSDNIVKLFFDPGVALASTMAQAGLFITIMAISQPFACVGTVGGGILRGLKDTRTPMVITVLAYWGCGFCLAMVLLLLFDMGGVGIWIGLVLGEVIVGMVFSFRLYSFYQNLNRGGIMVVQKVS